MSGDTGSGSSLWPFLLSCEDVVLNWNWIFCFVSCLALAMDLPDLPQLINLDLSEDDIVVVESPECGLDKTLQEQDFGDFFR